jgi:hypothetical protein
LRTKTTNPTLGSPVIQDYNKTDSDFFRVNRKHTTFSIHARTEGKNAGADSVGSVEWCLSAMVTKVPTVSAVKILG